MSRTVPLIALDDDPTGAQALAGIRVLLRWDADRIRRALAGRPAVHLLTNARALPPEEAYTVVLDAARAAVAAGLSARIVIRGDSTLRGHLLEEYLAVRDALMPTAEPPLLLVPALPAAGRVTVKGVHFIDRDGRRVPLHETEYAKDGIFAYTDARLLAWAEERSGGLFPAARGREIPLAAIRARGADAVAAALLELQGRGPAVCVPDAENETDLSAVAVGLEQALDAGAKTVVRCAPAFAGILGRSQARGLVAPPVGCRVLVVCGSYVPATTRQLARLAERRPNAFVEVDVAALASKQPESEVSRAAGAVAALLGEDGLAVLTTPRERPSTLSSLAAGERIAEGVARVVAALGPPPDVLVAKGGITSAVTLGVGVGADEADVVGPILPGISLWRARGRRGDLSYVVCPGNVGGDSLLVDVVDLVRAPRELPC